MAAELIQLPIARSSARFLLFCSRINTAHGLPVKRSNVYWRPSMWRTFAVANPERSHNPNKKRRLDEICLERFQQYSRTYIQSWILQGKVFVDGRVVSKAGTPVSDKSTVEIKAEVPKYVCRAGQKLEAAIEHFGIDVSGKVALDSGLSTGGFTDCLLQYGAAFVCGVDVGYGQVMPAVIKLMKAESTLITLVKPQFEARRSQVGKGGIVKDPQVHQEVLEKIIKGVEDFGFCNKGWIESPLKGAEGNTEFLVCFQRLKEKLDMDHEDQIVDSRESVSSNVNLGS